MPLSRPIAFFILTAFLTLAACSSPDTPTAVPTAQTEANTAPAELAPGQLRLVLAPEGNEARYLVTEQLARLNLPSDAIGATSAITGELVLNKDGTLVPGASSFSVDLSTLTSDSSRRDGFIKNNTLETRTYPNAVFVPTAVIGLPSPLPTSGAVAFQLAGDLTIRNVTRPVTWDFSGEVQNEALIGTARTAFTFGEFELTQPRVPVVLSVEDNIRLELDLHLVKVD